MKFDAYGYTHEKYRLEPDMPKVRRLFYKVTGKNRFYHLPADATARQAPTTVDEWNPT